MANGADTREMKSKYRMLWSLLLATVVSAACLLAPGAAQVQWPNRVIRLIVPFGAGSSSDTIARIIAAKLSEQLRQQVIVENRVGGSTIIGTEAIAKSAPDGYTLGLANTTTHAATSALTPNLPFDPIRDFSPIAMIGSSPFVLLGPPKGPSTLKEFVALAKANPGKLSYASAGTGTLTHLAGELVKWKTGIDVLHVPYRGSEQSLGDVLMGRLDLLVGTIPPTYSHVREGKLRAFAVMSEKRHPLLPDVPTVAEAGAAGSEAALWTALVTPAGVPAAVITRLSQTVIAIVNEPDVQQSLRLQGITPEPGSSDVVAARIRADLVKWKEVAAGAKISGAS